MTNFLINVNATSNGTANTDDMFIEYRSVASSTVFLKRITVTCPDITPDDVEVLVKITRNSTAGTFTSGTNFVPISARINMPSSLANASLTTCIIKNGTNASATLGTLTDTPKVMAFNQRAGLDWIARDKDEYIECPINGWIEILIQASAVSQVCAVSVVIEP